MASSFSTDFFAGIPTDAPTPTTIGTLATATPGLIHKCPPKIPSLSDWKPYCAISNESGAAYQALQKCCRADSDPQVQISAFFAGTKINHMCGQWCEAGPSVTDVGAWASCMAKEYGPALQDKDNKVAIECHHLEANVGKVKSSVNTTTATTTMMSSGVSIRVGNVVGLMIMLVGLVVRTV